MRATEDPRHGSASGNPDAAHDAQEQEQAQHTASDPEGLDASRAWHAARDFVRATGDLVLALGALLRSELSLARAAWPRMLGLLAVLAGLGLTLWLSVVALATWGLYVLTGSVGWALVALIVAHVILLCLARIGLKRTARHMSLPETRSEVRELLHRASHSS